MEKLPFFIVSVRSDHFRRNVQVPRQEFVDPVDEVIGDAGKDLPQVGFRIEAVELCGLDQRQDRGSAFAAFVRSREQPVLAAERNAPFILPMSAMMSRSIIGGIRISAKRFPFAVLKNERQVGF